MRAILGKLLRILDGTPAEYGQRQAGQSMVELALVTPLLIILLAGLVEIGWFANNYLTLLDVTRAGARRATVLVDQQSPVADAWFPEFSYVPWSFLAKPGDFVFRMPRTARETDDTLRLRYRWNEAEAELGTGACAVGFVGRLFYNEVICTMILTMEPLRLNQANGVDDIIVTGYSIANIDPRPFSNWLPADRPVPGDTPQMVVVGRYPAETNECDVIEIAPGTFSVSPRESRDPFDFNANGQWDVRETIPVIDGSNDFTEYGRPGDFDPIAGPADFENAEKQVGFSLFGNHRIPNSLCIGSEWTMRQVEDLFNLPNFEITDLDARRLLPGQGMVLVEMYWLHEMLLKIPVLSPVFTAVGNADGQMEIYVWAAFPLPALEPFILFPDVPVGP